MLVSKEIKNKQDWLATFSKKVIGKSAFYSMMSDPTRIKILLLLKHHEELCVTDLAEILKITVSAVSYQLSLLEKSNFLIRTKMGQIVCYCLNNDNQELLNLLN